MRDEVNDSSSEVRNPLWTEDGIARWIEGHLWTQRSGAKVTHTPIKMPKVVKAAKVEMLRIRFCIACGAAHHQGSQRTLVWQRIRTWCGGEEDPARCSDCGRSGLETLNHRCAECRELVGRLASITQGVADRVSIKVVVEPRRVSLFDRAQRTRESEPKKELRPPLVAGPAKITPPPPNPRRKYRKLRGETPIMPRVSVPPTELPKIPVHEMLRKFQHHLGKYGTGKGGTKKDVLSAAWSVIYVERDSWPQATESGKFVIEMWRIWTVWTSHGQQPEKARVRKMIQWTQQCRDKKITLTELSRNIDGKMNK
ncbi:MAG TPA: hypothetical protein QF873_00725 [Patescibacteria group bacterium]|nr:hypothetical protein [Patescibacteria group bacterium]